MEVAPVLINAFIVMHVTEISTGHPGENFTLLDMPGEWKLAYLNKSKFYEVSAGVSEFNVAYTQKAEEAFGYLDHEFKVISYDKCSRFYADPNTAHFCGLMLGWSTVGTDGQTYVGDDKHWTRLENECWYGDIDSVILNTVMPKDGSGACGCGDNYSAVEALGLLMSTQGNHPIVVSDEERKANRESTINADGALGAAMLFIAYVVDAAGLTEHGGSVYHGWLRLKGVYLSFMIAESALESARINAE